LLLQDPAEGVVANAYLMCLAERDLSVLLPVLPGLSGRHLLRAA
jgi:hypothetical protein